MTAESTLKAITEVLNTNITDETALERIELLVDKHNCGHKSSIAEHKEGNLAIYRCTWECQELFVIRTTNGIGREIEGEEAQAVIEKWRAI